MAGGRLVEAAGAIVLRRPPGKQVQVLLIHRPSYNDWSLPKGKLDPGEKFKQAALREVEEEVHLRCEIVGKRLAKVRYTDNRGRPKEVRWWRMRVVEDLGFAPNEEVDEVLWLRPADALKILTYAKDRELLSLIDPEQ